MKFDRFEDIIAWQKAKELTIQVYQLFENSKDFGFKDQIQRASVSVMNNIFDELHQLPLFPILLKFPLLLRLPPGRAVKVTT